MGSEHLDMALLRRLIRESAVRGRPEGLRRVLGAFAASGVELTQEELLDALWLAGRLPEGASTSLARASGTITPARQAYGDGWQPPAAGTPVAPKPARPGGLRPDADESRETDGSQAPPPGERPHAAGDPEDDLALRSTRTLRVRQPTGDAPLYGGTAPGHTPPHRTTPVRPVRTPETRALGSRQLQLGRALRPLKQTVADRRRWELDETATADSTAHSGLTDAVLRPARARWLDLTLLVDDGASMLLWQRLATETRLLLERSGAFRDVRVHGLDTRTPGAPLLGRRPFTPGTAVLPPATVTDPGGNTLILVLSDGVGAAWRDGRMRELLKQWGRFGPTAVLHALPPQLWDGSGIRAERWQVTTRRRGAPNLTWDVADPVLPAGLTAFDGVPVPVLAPEPGAVGAWAGLVASPGASAVLPLLTAPFDTAPRAPAGPDAGEHILRFRDTASPESYRLAAHLAAVAPVSVPVMRLVQDVLGPGVTTGHLAEVFLSGLFRRCDDAAELAPRHRSYDVTAEAREILLGTAPVRELLGTGRAVTARLTELAGRSADFPAWLAHPEGADRGGDGARPFGWVDERLMRRLGVGAPRAVPVTPVGPAPPPYVDAPGSLWRSLTPGNPRRAGPWHLFARHSSARSSSGMFLGRTEQGEVAAIRLTRPGSARRLSLAGQAEALHLLDGRRVPRLLGVDPAPEPSWLATELQLSDVGRPLPHLDGPLPAAALPDHLLHFARLAHAVAGVLADAHALGIHHGDLSPRRVLLTPGDVCVTGWCVQEHGDGAAHDVSKLGLVLLEAAGDAVPRSLTAILRRCGFPLLDRRPTAAEVAAHFEAFIDAYVRDPASHGAADDRLAVAIGRDGQGADVVLDFRAMGPHGVLRGTPEDCSTVLDKIVRDLADQHSPAAVQFHLLDSTERYLRTTTATALPHIVTDEDPRTLEQALDAERGRRRTLLAAARANGDPRPRLTSLIVVLTPQALPGELGWLEDLGIHLLLLEGTTRGPVDFDFRIDLTDGNPVLHHSGARPSGIPFRLPLPRRVPHEAFLAGELHAAVAHGRKGHHQEALSWLERLDADHYQHLGPDHPHLLATRYEIGHLQLTLDLLPEALASFSDCVVRREAVLGAEHVDTLTARQQCAFVLCRMGRHAEGQAIYRAVLGRWEEVRGLGHPDTLLCRHNLAVALIALGRYDEAVDEARLARSGRAAVLGGRHPSTLGSGHELAIALGGAGHTTMARRVARTVLEDRELVLGTGHPDTQATRRVLAELDPPGDGAAPATLPP
ncbi:SAV_2336 N-terminal domain-related protein [Streptomyces sp. NPDC058308]|uniref:SAV_2336 N-terminal domain-related protein n=1 Tax=Streptomyces sp. NPDC058308 TaxID=3346440 RepID=UPI0036F0EF93